MDHTPLPGNVERRQWVNRYYRLKVLPNVAEPRAVLAMHVLKLGRVEKANRSGPTFFGLCILRAFKRV